MQPQWINTLSEELKDQPSLVVSYKSLIKKQLQGIRHLHSDVDWQEGYPEKIRYGQTFTIIQLPQKFTKGFFVEWVKGYSWYRGENKILINMNNEIEIQPNRSMLYYLDNPEISFKIFKYVALIKTHEAMWAARLQK